MNDFTPDLHGKTIMVDFFKHKQVECIVFKDPRKDYYYLLNDKQSGSAPPYPWKDLGKSLSWAVGSGDVDKLKNNAVLNWYLPGESNYNIY